jgi:very-short-patch-repair endonuclease
LELDCYNEELKINIEYDGKQHYIFPNPFHKTKEEFEKAQENDQMKDQWCKDNGILNIRVKYNLIKKNEIKQYIIEQLKLNEVF